MSSQEAEFLASALQDAITEMEDMLLYVPDYFRYKWAYDARIAKAQDALAVYRLANSNRAFADMESSDT